ncbi:MAG: hypothetical protein H7829_17130 [Magnetococcus sp. THC-1_WYH]
MEFDPEIGSEICELIASGATLREALALDCRFPTPRQFSKWLRQNENFAVEYQQARQEYADFLVGEILKIAETEEDPRRAQLKIDSRKWIASKLKPANYGDKQTQEIIGAAGGPVKIEGNLWGGIMPPPKADE